MNATGRRSSKRGRSSARPRVVPRRVPRALRYNGENKITRTATTNLVYTSSGFSIGASFFQAVNLVFDPSSFTIYGSALVSQSTPLTNAAEIAALYDLLRIDKVEITWSSSQQANVAGGAFNAAPKFLVCNDSNDGIGPALLSEIQQQPNKEFYSVDGSSHKWTCHPKYQRIVYQTALVSSYEPTSGFINSNSTIPHFGVRMAIANLASLSGSGFVDFNVKFFFTLKDVK